MQIQFISISEAKDLFKNNRIIIFGAGDRGTLLLLSCLKMGASVLAVWDNDINKQGKSIHSIPIISYEDLLNYQGDYLLFVGCNYIKQEEKRIDKLNCKGVYYPYDREKLKEYYYKELKYLDVLEKEARDQKAYYKDAWSIRTLDLLTEDIVNFSYKHGYEIATDEEHYLIKEVVGAIGDKRLNYIDCGAFLAEFPVALIQKGIDFNQCYCFEMEKDILEKTKDRIRINGLNDKVTVVPYGVGEKESWIYYEEDGAATRVVEYETANKAKVVSLDSYCKDIKIDFIKMDIEGAELGALKGANRVILRDRPILAISIYHSLRDRIEIPKYLFNLLNDYRFILRHHSFEHAETVFYAIPMESVNNE